MGPPSLQHVSHKCPSLDRDPVTSGLLRLTTESRGRGEPRRRLSLGAETPEEMKELMEPSPKRHF